MNSLKLRVVLSLTLEIHLSEHVKSRLLALGTCTSSLARDGAGKLPTAFVSAEAESLAVVAGSNDLILRLPDQALKREKLSGDGDYGTGRLLRSGWVDDRDAAVMSSKSKTVTAGRKGNRVHPACRVVQVLAADGVERQTLAPGAGLRLFVDALDEAGEDAGVCIGRTGSQQNRVGMPGNAGDGAADRLLEVLGHPPVVLLLKVADGNDAVTGTDGEFGFRRRPANKRSSPANA